MRSNGFHKWTLRWHLKLSTTKNKKNDKIKRPIFYQRRHILLKFLFGYWKAFKHKKFRRAEKNHEGKKRNQSRNLSRQFLNFGQFVWSSVSLIRRPERLLRRRRWTSTRWWPSAPSTGTTSSTSASSQSSARSLTWSPLFRQGRLTLGRCGYLNKPEDWVMWSKFTYNSPLDL